MTGRQVREIRESLKLTQRELAALTGISQNTISRIETNQHSDPGKYLKDIASVLEHYAILKPTQEDKKVEVSINELNKRIAHCQKTLNDLNDYINQLQPHMQELKLVRGE